MRAVNDKERRRASRRGFGALLFISVVIHAGAFAAVVYAQGRAPKLQTPSGAIPVELVRLGKERDEQLLPRKVAPPPPPPPDAVALETPDAPPPPPKPKPPPPKPKSADEQMSDAARRLLQDAANSRLDEALDKLEAEGSADGSVHGTTTDPNRAARGYEAQVGALLKQRYRIPDLIPQAQRRFLVAEVLLIIESNGRISRHQFTKSHPNQLFMQALERLLKTTQLPPPPRTLRRLYKKEGMLVRFVP